ncbi:MAG: mechanosensitive ion channel [Deltaproteobacteria bacterium]|nr:mechanosensitive ion channel [Deltaproteobacteria bacterium]
MKLTLRIVALVLLSLAFIAVLGARSSFSNTAIADYIPSAIYELKLGGVLLWRWLGLILAISTAIFFGVVLARILHAIAAWLTKQTKFSWDDELLVILFGPVRLLLAIGTFAIFVRWLQFGPQTAPIIDQWLRVFTIAGLTWAVLCVLGFISRLLAARFSRDGSGAQIQARGVITQTLVLKRVLGVVIVFLGVTLMLLQFDGMKVIGTSLLASAGVAGLVLGLAAQRSIGMLLAGIQISFTQPLRVGDVVIMENEWGTIEEITLTYVVVKIWDLRRLVMPITAILEKPFQNWTRSSANILGTVYFHADYTVDVDALRSELERYVKTRDEWDKVAIGLVVTNATAQTLELRALVSSENASKNWDLRCAVREHMIKFLQQYNEGKALPRTRIELLQNN